MNDELDQRIARHLHDQARLVDIGAPSVVSVTRRAAQRRNRRRTAVGVAGIAVVSAATIFGIQALSHPHTSRIVPARPEQPPAPGLDPALVVPSNLVWNRFEPDSTRAIAYASTRVAVDDGFLAWSTQPGRSNSPSLALYRSSNGIAWDQVTDAVVDQPSSLTAAGGRLYSFGTSPATAPGVVGQATVGVSTDDAATWQRLDLPVDLGDLGGLGDDVLAAVSPVAFAAGDHGAIAVVDVTPHLSTSMSAAHPASAFTDDGLQLPDECNNVVTGITATTIEVPAATATTVEDSPVATTALPAATATTVSGPPEATTTNVVQVMPPCVTDTTPPASRTMTWADLGADPATAAVFARPAQVFLSTDGEHFAPVGTLPAAPAGYRTAEARAIATTDGFAITRYLYGGDGSSPVFQLLTSRDGSSWTTTVLPAFGLAGLGELADGAVAAVGYSGNNGPAVTVVRDGAVRTVDLRSLLNADDGPNASLQAYFAGDAGTAGLTIIAGMVEDRVKAAGQPSMTRDGVTLTLLDESGARRFSDATTGAELTATATLDAGTGMERYVVTKADGATVTFTADDVASLFPQIGPSSTPRLLVLHSDDGISWSRDDFAALSGIDQIGAVNVTSSGNQVIVTATDAPTGTPAPDAPLPATIVLVGTPTS